MSSKAASQAIFVPYTGWGHVRPVVHLALQLLEIHPSLHITVLYSSAIAPQFDTELKNVQVSSGLRARLRMIDVQLKREIDARPAWQATISDLSSESSEALREVVPAYMEDVLRGKELIHGQKNEWAGMKTGFILYDLLGSWYVPETVISVCSAASIPPPATLVWFPVHAAFTISHFTPASDQAGPFSGDATLLDLPDTGTVYGWEIRPMEPAAKIPPEFWDLALRCLPALLKSTPEQIRGMVLPVAEEMTPNVRKRYEQGTGKELICVGPSVADAVFHGQATGPTGAGDPTLAWLDQMVHKQGERCAAYVSFGSTHFPQHRPDLAVELLTSLADAGIPFVFANSSQYADKLPSSLATDLEARGADFRIVPWVPQWNVLLHPATRFFISHCGTSSVNEAIFAGLPILSTVFGSDQPHWAMSLEKTGASIPIHQFKCFEDAPKTLMNGVTVHSTKEALHEELQRIYADLKDEKRYAEMRQKMADLRELLRKSVQSGASHKALQSFGQYLQ